MNSTFKSRISKVFYNFSLSRISAPLVFFLIVVGLFLSYGVLYDHIIDREKKTNGLNYMLIHVFIIFAMNNITNGLEFMREEELSVLPKMLFLIGSFLLFFVCLFVLGSRYAKAKSGGYKNLSLQACGIGAAFVLVMLLLRDFMQINILISAVFVFAVLGMIYWYGKKIESAGSSNS